MVLQTSGAITLNDVQTEFGGSNPIDISEYYRGGTLVPDTAANSGIPTSGNILLSDFYGGDATTTLTEDPYYELNYRAYAGGQYSTWQTYSLSWNAYAGQKGRILFVYRNGTAGTSYQGDWQLDDINLDGNSYSFESNSQDWITSTDQTNTVQYRTSSTNWKFQYYKNNYLTIPTGTTSGRWNRDSGGTPSSGTGLTTADDGSYYIYAETSGTSTSGFHYTCASPLIQLSSNPGNLTFANGQLGGNIGLLAIYWAENVATDPYPGQGPFAPTNCAILPRTRLNGSTSSNNYFWPGGNGGTGTDYAFGTYPSGPSNGQTCAIAIAYVSGNSFTTDFQLDDAAYNATSEGNGNASNGGTDMNIDGTGSSGWQQSTSRRTFSSTSFPSASSTLFYVNNDTFVDLASGTVQGSWNIDSSGTPSGSTGNTSLADGGAYCYWEGSGSTTGYGYRHKTLLSRPFNIDTSSGKGFAVQMGNYGAAIGRMQVFLLW
jgi:hypothetical protein